MAYKACLYLRNDEDKLQATQLEKVKARIITEAKRQSYRSFVDEVAQGEGLWKLSQ